MADSPMVQDDQMAAGHARPQPEAHHGDPDVRRRLAPYDVRYRLVAATRVAQHLAFSALSVLSLGWLVDRLVWLSFPVAAAAVILASAVLVAFLVFFLFVRRRAPEVGYAVDRTAGLKNLVASALDTDAVASEAGHCVMARAVAALAERQPRHVFPWRMEWTGRYLYVPGIVLLIAWIMPDVDLLKRRADQAKREAERAAVQQGVLKLVGMKQSLPVGGDAEPTLQAKQLSLDLDKLVTDLKDAAQHEALIKIGEFEARYRDSLAAAQRLDRLAQGLDPTAMAARFAPEHRDAIRDFLKDVKGGEYAKAAEVLRDLAKEMKGENLSPAARRALAGNLAKLAEQMQGAGLSPELADLLRQVEGSAGDFAQLMQLCEQASEALGEAADFLQDSEGLKALRDGLAGARNELMGEAFSNFNAQAVEQYLQQEATLGALCPGCQGAGCALCMGGNGEGSGTGGEGRGRGGQPPENPTDTAFKAEKDAGKLVKGRILQEVFVSGIPDKGEARAQYVDAVRAAQAQAAGALAREDIPREYEGMVKGYFDELAPPRTEGTDNAEP